jgi:DNA-binding MarR family transcriptional regulator
MYNLVRSVKQVKRMATNQTLTHFERGAGFLLSRLGAMAEREWARIISAVKLTQAEFYILTLLDEIGRMRQRDVAIRAALDPRNVVETVAKLTRRRLIVVESDEYDGRAKNLSISTEGKARLERLREVLVSERASFFAPLSVDEYRQLCALLARVYDQRVQDHRSSD